MPFPSVVRGGWSTQLYRPARRARFASRPTSPQGVEVNTVVSPSPRGGEVNAFSISCSRGMVNSVVSPRPACSLREQADLPTGCGGEYSCIALPTRWGGECLFHQLFAGDGQLSCIAPPGVLASRAGRPPHRVWR